MSDIQNTSKKRPIPCPCGCDTKFIPTKYGQKFANSDHRKAYWSRIQQSAALKDYQEFLKVRATFLRYLKHKSRIDAWLKANKK